MQPPAQQVVGMPCNGILGKCKFSLDSLNRYCGKCCIKHHGMRESRSFLPEACITTASFVAGHSGMHTQKLLRIERPTIPR